MATIGERLLEVRKDLGLTQAQFAGRLGVSRSYLSEVELGRGKPSVEMIAGMATAFPQFSLTWLLTGKGPKLATLSEGRWPAEELQEAEISGSIGPHPKDIGKALDDLTLPLSKEQERLLTWFVPVWPLPTTVDISINLFEPGSDRKLQVYWPLALSRGWAQQRFGCPISDLYVFETSEELQLPPLFGTGMLMIARRQETFEGAGLYVVFERASQRLRLVYVLKVDGPEVRVADHLPSATFGTPGGATTSSDHLECVAEVVWSGSPVRRLLALFEEARRLGGEDGNA